MSSSVAGNKNIPVRLAVLVSGGGTNLQSLIDEEKRLVAEGSFCIFVLKGGRG